MTENTKLTIPNLLKGRIDLKAITVSNVINIVESLSSGDIDEAALPKNTKVLIYTTFGTVSGKLLPIDSEENHGYKNIEMLHKVLFRVRNNHLDSFESDKGITRVISDTGYIALVDAEVTYYAAPTRTNKLAYFLLFSDQVVGLTLGELA
jgi:hypothetical protein